MAFGTAVAFLPQVKSGKLDALAVTDAKRSPLVSDLQTVAESGLPGFEALQWFGILVPAATPQEIVAKLHNEIERILDMPHVRERLQALGIQVASGSPEQFAAFMKAETEKWGEIVRASGAKVD